MSSNNPRKFSEKIALQNQKAQEDLDRYNGIMAEIKKAKNSSLRDIQSAVSRESQQHEEMSQSPGPSAAANANTFNLQPSSANSGVNSGSMSGLVSVSGHTVVSPVSSGGSSTASGSRQTKYLSPAYPSQAGGARAGSLPNVTALLRNNSRIDLQSALANLNMLTDSTYRSGVPIANATVPPAGSSRLSRSSDGRGSLRGVPGVGGGGAAAGFHNSGSSSNVLMNSQPHHPVNPNQVMNQHHQQQHSSLMHPPHPQQQQHASAQPQMSPTNLCLNANHPLGGSSNMSRHRVDTSPYGSYLLPPGGTSNDNSWRRTISDSRLYESASQPRRVPVGGGMPCFGPDSRGPGPAPRLSFSSKSKSPSNRGMHSRGDRRKMSDDQQMMSYHRDIIKSMQHSSPSPDSSAQQSPDTGSPATPGTRQHSLTIASPPMLNSTAMNMPRPPSSSNMNPPTSIHTLSPNENPNMASSTTCAVVSPNHPGGSLPDLSSGGGFQHQSAVAARLRNPNEVTSPGAFSISGVATAPAGCLGGPQGTTRIPNPSGLIQEGGDLQMMVAQQGCGGNVFMGNFVGDAMGSQMDEGGPVELGSISPSNSSSSPNPHHLHHHHPPHRQQQQSLASCSILSTSPVAASSPSTSTPQQYPPNQHHHHQEQQQHQLLHQQGTSAHAQQVGVNGCGNGGPILIPVPPSGGGRPHGGNVGGGQHQQQLPCFSPSGRFQHHHHPPTHHGTTPTTVSALMTGLPTGPSASNVPDALSVSPTYNSDNSSYSGNSSVALPLNLSTSFTPRQPLMQSNSCSSSNSQQQSSSSSKALLSSHGNNSIDPNRANNHTPSVVVTSAMNPNHPTKILTGTCGGSSEGSGWKFNSPGGGAADAYDNLPSTSPNSSYRTCSETQTSSMAMVNSHVQSSSLAGDPVLFSSDDYTPQSLNAYPQPHQHSPHQRGLSSAESTSPNALTDVNSFTGMSPQQQFNRNQILAAAGGGALSEVVTSGEGAGQFDDPSYMESLFNAASLSQIHQQMSYMKVSQDMDPNITIQGQQQQPTIYVSEAQQSSTASHPNTSATFESVEMLFDPNGVNDLIPAEGELTPVAPNDLSMDSCAANSSSGGLGSISGNSGSQAANQISSYLSQLRSIPGATMLSSCSQQHQQLLSQQNQLMSRQQQQNMQVPDIVLTRSEEMDFLEASIQEIVSSSGGGGGGGDSVTPQNVVSGVAPGAGPVSAGMDPDMVLEPLTEADLRLLEDDVGVIDVPGLDDDV
ncbi:uncharacterized protein LOC142349566 isoform X1 [Convolutriloba macropyga]|uniref:uncharacterized protein LOC142349566 isoform X1 n=1 Tax=Convolutriloba macropyga TaxID=536237 RepID=UPI003F527837